MRAFSRYRSLLKQNTELKEEISKLDLKFDQAFLFLLDKIDALTQGKNTIRKSLGFKIAKRGGD